MNSPPRLAQALDEIKAWAEANANEAIANLDPPATRQLLAKLEFSVPLARGSPECRARSSVVMETKPTAP